MPEKYLPLVTRLTRQIGTKDYPDAREEAKRILRERGHMHKNSEKLTKEGERRQAMGPAGRAIDRAAKRSGHPASDFKYVGGRAVLK
jgi:DNA-binding MurR/RpiR family transcriptional regulator